MCPSRKCQFFPTHSVDEAQSGAAIMIREEGTQVNDTPKIQVNDPTTNDHSIYFPNTGFRIPLSLWGVFSYFPSLKPMA